MDKKVVGILGGGQLGRMTIEAANRLNVTVAVLDAPNNPASELAASAPHVHGTFRSEANILALAAQCQILTVEIEHVDCDALDKAASVHGVQVYPTPQAVRIIQDKYLQKEVLSKAGVPCAEYRDLEVGKEVEGIKSAAASVAAAGFGYPIMLKSKTMAYDGRGNRVIQAEKDVASAVDSLGGGPSRGGPPLYVEKMVSFKKELAVMVAQSVNGDVAGYPCVETVQSDNICSLVIAPAQIDGLVRKKAQKVAEQAVAALKSPGVFGVEMFWLPTGEILLNEIAPRPHNSGHYTTEACHTSQFEQHMRCILGLPLGSTSLKVPAASMVNILGLGDGDAGLAETLKPCTIALSTPGATVHLYGKKECRKGRKMGHVTIVGDSMQQVSERTAAIQAAANPTSVIEFDPKQSPLVGIIMGSDSDLPTLKPAADLLCQFKIPFEITIVSAHRTPLRMVEYAQTARERGLKVIIAAAGGAAHLPGMVAALTSLPVIGVPVALKVLDGQDSLLSIVQMPRGVPVATVAINNSTNAALLAARILGSSIPHILDQLEEFRAKQEEIVMKKVDELARVGYEDYRI
ncbi:AIR carboxylase-domain-containing protein [Phlyctochytrium arcticum]|nr:AIR carboxylase-domain-containing protein [Phlyctochytrium arcticum]